MFTLARQTFSDKKVAVAIGPQIDVFTSPDYVILHQIHFVTSSGQLVDQGYRSMPILPDPKSLSEAVAKIVKYLDWNKVAFLSQGKERPRNWIYIQGLQMLKFTYELGFEIINKNMFTLSQVTAKVLYLNVIQNRGETSLNDGYGH